MCWGSGAKGPDVSMEALPYLMCSGVLLFPLFTLKCSGSGDEQGGKVNVTKQL